jgi:predicted alpha/beta hydrolase family esterase
MTAQVLFVQGAGSTGAYDADGKLVESLRSELGATYDVRYPRMPNESEPDYDTWTRRIDDELARMGAGVILVGHSIGGSIVIKWLTEHAPEPPLAGVLLLATPFWHDDAVWRWKEVELPQDAATRLPRGLRLFLYHGTDDETVPIAHLDRYAKAFPEARVRRLRARNHQLNDDLTEIARDIRSLN